MCVACQNLVQLLSRDVLLFQSMAVSYGLSAFLQRAGFKSASPSAVVLVLYQPPSPPCFARPRRATVSQTAQYLVSQKIEAFVQRPRGW